MPLIKKQNKLTNYNKIDKELIASLAKKRLPSFKQIKYLNKFLTKKELLLTSFGALLFLVGIFFVGASFYQNKIEIKPSDGGKYTEGAVGAPQYINPLYANLNGVDADLSKLIYSSLFTRDKNGFLAKDLVEDYKLEADQKTHTFKIRKGVKWNNGAELTADDVIFTIETIQDPSFHSPLKSYLAGVDVKKIDDYSFSLTLPEPYAPFPELLTFGILPKEFWQEISPSGMSLAELNLKPIGSGPYEFLSLIKDKNGEVKSITLKTNDSYYGTKPFIDKLTFKFFPSTEELIAAINNGQVDGASYLSNENTKEITAKNSYNFYHLIIPQNTALFFNLRNKDLAINDIKVRQALAFGLNKKDLVDKIFGENAEAIYSPLHPKSFGYTDSVNKYEYNLDKAKTLLKESGWELKEVADGDTKGNFLVKNNQILKVKLTTTDNLDDIKVAEAVSANWQDLGVKTELDIVNKNDIQAKAIKAKDFNILLYSWTVGTNPDPYTMWHSSQSGEKGQNISGYANTKIDKILEDSRLTNNLDLRKKNYEEFQKQLTNDLPAIFLYTPHYIYAQDRKIKGFDYQVITSAEERLGGVSLWYLKESRSLNLKK